MKLYGVIACILLFFVSYAEAQITVSASSEWAVQGGLRADYARDGDPATYWSCDNLSSQTGRSEWIALDLKEATLLSKITLTPRATGAGFPIDFEIQSSADGSTWTTVDGHSYTNYTNPGSNVPIDFDFGSEGLSTQYIRVFASNLARIGAGEAYMFHLAEFDYAKMEVLVSASSVWATQGGLHADYARDGDPASYWSCENLPLQAGREEWIALDFRESLCLSKICLTPRSNGAGFPIDFEIQSSADGSSWTAVDGHSYSNYANPGSNVPIDFDFGSEGLSTQYIRVFASNLARIGAGEAYMFHLAEFDYSEMIYVPDAPTEVLAVGLNSKARVSFALPENDGGSAITHFSVRSNPGEIVTTGTESPIKIEGLENGTSYSFTVTALNAAGSSAESMPSNTVTPIAPSIHEAPNIIVLLSDDQRWDALGYAGNEVISTPNLDQMAQAGTYFRNAFVTTPICCASRAGILTGQYARTNGVPDFFNPVQLETSYPAILRHHNYHTGFIGKWGTLDADKAYFAESAALFDYWAGSMYQANFWHDKNCNYVLNNGTSQKQDFYCDCPADSRGIEGEEVRIGKANIPDPVHLTSYVIPKKLDQFFEQRNDDKPFCLSVSFKTPHGPWGDFDEKYQEYYEGLKMPVSESVDMEDALSRPDFLRNSLSADNLLKIETKDDIDGPLQSAMRQYYRLINGMDETIGKLVQDLKDRGLYENTVIIFLSDNGYFLDEHGFNGKWLMYEESIRVPYFILDGRAETSNVTSDAMVLNIDVAPTILQLADIEVPETMEGKSIVPLLDGSVSELRDEVFFEHLYGHGSGMNHIERSESVRTKEWKYIHYVDQSGAFAEELYHLLSDSLEMNDLSEETEYLPKLMEMREDYEAYHAEPDGAKLSDLKINGVSIEGFHRDTLSYTYVCDASVSEVPSISYSLETLDASVSIRETSIIPGSTFLFVTYQGYTRTYTVNFVRESTAIWADKKHSIAIFPTLANEYVHVSGLQSECSIELFSLTGAKLFSEKTSSASYSISISHIAKGIYFLRVKNELGIIAKESIVIQ